MKQTQLWRRLLIGGMISTPFFYIIAIVQMFTRTGFDIKRHAISSLTLGDMGWIQSANFVITGLLAVLAAVGIRGLLKGSQGGTWGAGLIGIYGVGMMLAGIFVPDPGLGFPSGAPEGAPMSMSAHAAVHTFAFFIAFICLIAACFVFRRRFAVQGEQAWSKYSVATGLIAPLLIMIGTGIGVWIGVIMACAGLVAFGWVSALAAKLWFETA